jgi:hypothetical protein
MAGVVSAREALEIDRRRRDPSEADRGGALDSPDQLVMWSDPPSLPLPAILVLMIVSGLLAGGTAWLVLVYVL